ncbi:MAG: DUF2163 domain-containing protein [Pseudomonadota bacterium]
MRTFPLAMTDALASSATTISNAWIIKRTDGLVIGLTDHDTPLLVDGVDCQPLDGVDRSRLEASVGTNSDTASLTGILSSDRLSEEDIENGLFDDAYLEHYLVDWSDAEKNVKLRTHIMGEIRREDGAFVVELRGAAGLLSRPNGRYFTRSCSVRFCDADCGLNEADFSYPVSVLGSLQSNIFSVALPPDLHPDKFNHGLIRLNGDGLEWIIQSVVAMSDGCRLTVAGNVPEDLEFPLPSTLVEGCDRSFSTCRDRFANTVNFRGFPHMPGNYQILSYVDEESRHDGGPIVP